MREMGRYGDLPLREMVDAAGSGRDAAAFTKAGGTKEGKFGVGQIPHFVRNDKG